MALSLGSASVASSARGDRHYARTSRDLIPRRVPRAHHRYCSQLLHARVGAIDGEFLVELVLVEAERRSCCSPQTRKSLLNCAADTIAAPALEHRDLLVGRHLHVEDVSTVSAGLLPKPHRHEQGAPAS